VILGEPEPSAAVVERVDLRSGAADFEHSRSCYAVPGVALTSTRPMACNTAIPDAMTRRARLALAPMLLGLVACRGSGRAQPGAADAADAAVTAAEVPEDAGALFPRGGRVFFADDPNEPEIFKHQELFVEKDDFGTRVVFRGEDLTTATVDAQGHVVHVGNLDTTLAFTLHADGTFDGSRKTPSSTLAVWRRAPPPPLPPALLTSGLRLEGFLGSDVRYRMHFWQEKNETVGVARYVTTRDDLRMRGILNDATRTLELDERTPDGDVVGHVTATLIDAGTRLVGSWTSADGTRRLPLLLLRGFYPDRLALGARAVSAQEHYADDCGAIEDFVHPVVDGLPPRITQLIDAELGTLTLRGHGYPEPFSPDVLARTQPGSSVDWTHCAGRGPNDRGHEQSVFIATPLGGPWFAFEIAHYAQRGTAESRSWSDCVVVSLATAEMLEPAALLDATTRATLTDRARKAAVANVAEIFDGGRVKDPRLLLEAARALELDGAPLCVEETKVRFVTPRSAFAPPEPVFTRDEVARLLPAGKLRSLVEKKTAGTGSR
jgi:hypothetical protein